MKYVVICSLTIEIIGNVLLITLKGILTWPKILEIYIFLLKNRRFKNGAFTFLIVPLSNKSVKIDFSHGSKYIN